VLITRAATNQTPYIVSDGVGRTPVVPGDTIGFTCMAKATSAGAEAKVRVTWYNAQGVAYTSSASTLMTFYNTTQRQFTLEPVVAPAGATFAQIQVYMDSGPVNSVRVTQFRIQKNEATDLFYFDGDTANNSDYDYTWISTANQSASKWTTKFIEEIPDRYVSDDDPQRTVIELTAVDNIQRMSAEDEPRGIYRIADLPYIMEGKGVPWIINGSSDQVGSTFIVSMNDGAKLIDQVAITRDSDQGYAWVNRNNVFVANNAVVMPTQIQGVFNEDDYSEIKVDYDTDSCINSVGVTWLRYVDGETEEVPYPAVVDQASIDKYGRHHQDFTIHGLVENPADILAFQQSILVRASTPKVRVLGFSMPIIYNEDIRVGKALIDLYDLVTVRYGHSNVNDDMRVTALSHDISTDHGWVMALGFKHDGAVASVIATPSVKTGVNFSPVRMWMKKSSSRMDAFSGSTATNVPGLLQTIKSKGVNDKWLITVTLDVQIAAQPGSASALVIELKIDGAIVPETGTLRLIGVNARGPGIFTYLMENKSLGDHTVQATVRGGSSTSTTFDIYENSKMSIVKQ
jgi:hypothetical protein